MTAEVSERAGFGGKRNGAQKVHSFRTGSKRPDVLMNMALLPLMLKGTRPVRAALRR